jgi:hypothetical protein
MNSVLCASLSNPLLIDSINTDHVRIHLAGVFKCECLIIHSNTDRGNPSMLISLSKRRRLHQFWLSP